MDPNPLREANRRACEDFAKLMRRPWRCRVCGAPQQALLCGEPVCGRCYRWAGMLGLYLSGHGPDSGGDDAMPRVPQCCWGRE